MARDVWTGQSASEVDSIIQNMIDKAIANCDWDLLTRLCMQRMIAQHVGTKDVKNGMGT